MADWDGRELCPDGGCTGLIGPDGTCKVCGRAAPNWGDERKRGLIESSTDDESKSQSESSDDADETAAAAAPRAPGERGEWRERALCPDGACIGVIGDDGTCKVCGKAGVASEADEHDDEDEDGEEYEDESAEYEDDEDEDEYEDEDDEDDELAAAADELAGVAPSDEVARAEDIASSERDDRKLCPDGGCIGLIGDDGKCKVCGKEAA